MKIRNATIAGAAFGALSSIFLLEGWLYGPVRMLNFPAYALHNKLARSLAWNTNLGIDGVRFWSTAIMPIVQWGLVGFLVGFALAKLKKGTRAS